MENQMKWPLPDPAAFLCSGKKPVLFVGDKKENEIALRAVNREAARRALAEFSRHLELVYGFEKAMNMSTGMGSGVVMYTPPEGDRRRCGKPAMVLMAHLEETEDGMQMMACSFTWHAAAFDIVDDGVRTGHSDEEIPTVEHPGCTLAEQGSPRISARRAYRIVFDEKEFLCYCQDGSLYRDLDVKYEVIRGTTVHAYKAYGRYGRLCNTLRIPDSENMQLYAILLFFDGKGKVIDAYYSREYALKQANE